MTIRTLLIGAGLAASLASPAPAFSPRLPPEYVGEWCMLEGYEGLGKMLFEERKDCEQERLAMTWFGFTFAPFGGECSFRSIRETGERFAPATKTPWSMQVPEVEYSIRCADGYADRYRMHIGKGGVLHIETLTPLPKPKPKGK